MPTFDSIRLNQPAPKQSTKQNHGQRQGGAAPARQAAARTRQRNKQEWTADLTCVGDPRIAAGSTFRLRGQGVYNGRYIADEVTHTISNNGYVTAPKGTRTLVGY